MVAANELVCFYDEVVIGRTVKDSACHFQPVTVWGCFSFYGVEFECVLKVDGVEHGFEVVVSVGAALCDVEPDVYFCVRIVEHC